MQESGPQRNYGNTVSKEAYEWGLKLHQYIPQADQGILDEIESLAEKRDIKVLDLGCGPGRLTERVAALPGVEVEGLDVSPQFIEAAQKHTRSRTRYMEKDFLAYDSSKKYDVIFMQGVLHHVHGADREGWLKKISVLLSPDGRLIVGDEFIPPYEESNEEERKTKAGLFYLHIIGEALKAKAKKKDMDLATEECLNFIADVLSSEDVCGYYDIETLEYIKKEASEINKKLFILDGRTDSATIYQKTEKVIKRVREAAKILKAAGEQKRIDRGDYKISLEVCAKECAPYFEVLTERKFGPVDEIGGMAVLTFQKAKANS